MITADPRARAAAEEALRLARSQPGSVCLLYPLAAVVNANGCRRRRPSTRRGRRSNAASTAPSDGGGHRSRRALSISSRAESRQRRRPASQWRERVLVDCTNTGERFMVSTNLATAGDMFAASFPALAADARCDRRERRDRTHRRRSPCNPASSISPLEQPELVADARARASAMSYDEAMEHIFASIDAILAEHGLKSGFRGRGRNRRLRVTSNMTSLARTARDV